jgi:hypothetical protein
MSALRYTLKAAEEQVRTYFSEADSITRHAYQAWRCIFQEILQIQVRVPLSFTSIRIVFYSVVF